MRHVGFWLGIALVAALTIFSGVLQGKMRNRWGASSDIVAAAGKLVKIPSQFGDWRLQSSESLDETSSRMLECAASMVRNYENQATGDTISVTLVLGPPGPISVHTPEVCFGSRNFKSRSEREKTAIPGGENEQDEFWAMNYAANNLRGDLIRVYYAWSKGDRWSAPKDARFWSAGQPYLYKMQLLARLAPGANEQSEDPCLKFLQEFLPAARDFLVAPSAN